MALRTAQALFLLFPSTVSTTAPGRSPGSRWRPGAALAIPCACLVLSALAPPVRAASVTTEASPAVPGFDVVLRAPGAEVPEAPPVEGTLRWHAGGGPGPASPARVVEVHGPGRYRLPTGATRRLGRLEVRVPGFWAPSRVVSAGAGEVELWLVPTGTLVGELERPRGTSLPTALDLDFGPASHLQTLAAAPSGELAGRVSCPVDPEGRWRCEVPRGTHDLRWHAPGFASVLRFDVAVAAGEARELDALSLVPGAAVLGFVELPLPAPAGGSRSGQQASVESAPELTEPPAEPHCGGLAGEPSGQAAGDPGEESAEPPAGEPSERPAAEPAGEPGAQPAPQPQRAAPRVTVRLVPAGGSSPRHDTRRRLGYLEQEAEIGPEGLFQFTGLRAGSYRVVASAQGLVPAESPLVRVLEGRESRLSEPLRLRPPAVQEVWVSPARTPAGERWRVLLARPGVPEPPAVCLTGPTGACRFDELAPGEYRLTVEGPPGSVWHQERVEVAEGALPLRVDLPLVPVEGVILLGDHPLRARMVFHRDDEERGVELFSDHDGRFHGHLPGDGEWWVDAWFERRGAEHSLGAVTVERPPAGERHRIELELPDTRVRGRVVGPGGGAVTGARAHLLREPRGERGTSSARTGDDGSFRLWGLEEGRYRARASGRRSAARSDPFEVRDGETAEVEVRLPGTVPLEGRVRSGDGPVAGAEVHLLAVPVERGGGVARVVTGPGGGFRAEVPVGTTAVRAAVLAPGRAARIGRWTLPRSGPLVLRVDSLGGTLRLSGSSGLAAGLPLERDGAWVYLGVFHRWSRLHGLPGGLGRDTWTLPHMAAGTYRLCRSPAGPCSEGTLAVGGVLDLALPPPAEGGGGGSEASPAGLR